MLISDFKRQRVWEFQKKLIKRFYKGEIRDVLDVGCRTGNFLMHFEAEVNKYGVELATDYCVLAEKRGIKIYNDFIENIKFEKQFDVVSCYAVLEHVSEPMPLIDNLKSLVNKDGLLVIMVPWHQCLKEKFISFFGYRWHMYSPPEHLNLFSKQVLVDRICKANEYSLVFSYASSGGNFNPFKGIPLVGKLFSLAMSIFDQSPFNQLAIFDHLYLYFRKN